MSDVCLKVSYTHFSRAKTLRSSCVFKYWTWTYKNKSVGLEGYEQDGKGVFVFLSVNSEGNEWQKSLSISYQFI